MPYGYFILGGWIIVLSLYLHNAFRQITKLEKRVEWLERPKKSNQDTKS
jgi:hypothetical protein